MIKRIQYLGQNGFVISDDRLTICFDLYLSDKVYEETGTGIRNYPAPCRIADIKNIDYYFVSHNHMDHLDIPTIRELIQISDRVKFICPITCVDAIIETGVSKERVLCARAYKKMVLFNIEVFPIPVKHEEYTLVNGEHAFLGYAIKWDHFSFFHAGDAIADNELARDLLPYSPYDVMFLPINGHDWKRNNRDLLGNMNYREALDLVSCVPTELIVPMHYDLFNDNTENPAFFVDYLYREYPTQKFKMFMPGERIWVENKF